MFTVYQCLEILEAKKPVVTLIGEERGEGISFVCCLNLMGSFFFYQLEQFSTMRARSVCVKSEGLVLHKYTF